jgi:hypothetical protein
VNSGIGGVLKKWETGFGGAGGKRLGIKKGLIPLQRD